MNLDKKAADLLKKHNGSKEHTQVTIAEIIRIGKKIKNEYLVIYYEQLKVEVEKA